LLTTVTMSRVRYEKCKDFVYSLSPWILVAACVLLLFVLILFTVNNYQREKRLVVEALTQKGMTIIRFINSTSRESMRANLRGSQKMLPWEEHVQIAIEQAVEQSGVDYVALITPDNQLVAGAGNGFPDKKIDAATLLFLKSLRHGPTAFAISRYVEDEESHKGFFQVAGPFKPLGGRGRFPGTRSRSGSNLLKMNKAGHHPMFEHMEKEINRIGKLQPVLIVQLNFEKLGSLIRWQVVQLTILLIVFTLVAVGSFLSLQTLRGLKGSRLRLGKVEKELQRSERLAALGKMAAGVAHELRNPLSSIKGLALLLKSKFDDGESGVEAADTLVQEVERLNRSIGELLDYAKPAKLNRTCCDVNVIIEKTVLLIGMDLQAMAISLSLHLDSGLPAIEVDEDKLNQVFLNLFLNAIQSMESGGILTVRSYLEGENIVVAVEDTGIGIIHENLQKVFDPYFTTKNDGTGLGLAMSAKIVEEHDGKILITSEPGQGTTVQVLIPGTGL